MTICLCNVCAQMLLASIDFWLKLDPSAGLWVRVKCCVCEGVGGRVICCGLRQFLQFLTLPFSAVCCKTLGLQWKDVFTPNCCWSGLFVFNCYDGNEQIVSSKCTALLAEVEHLAQDRLDLQRQAEKDHSSLSQRIRALERELEEQETKGLETEQHHKTHTEDLHQRVQALEKQLKHNRQFIEVHVSHLAMFSI